MVLASCTLVKAGVDADGQWIRACVAGIKAKGGRGSNASNRIRGDSAGLLAFVRSLVETKMTVLQSQKVARQKDH